MSTRAEIVTKAIIGLRQVAGSGVQTYSEPLMQQFFDQIYDMVHGKAWWPLFMHWDQSVLDGSTGVITANLAQGDEVVNFDDIRAIFPDHAPQTPLSRLPRDVNPFELTGTLPLYYEALTSADANLLTKVFHVWPKAATGTLTIHHRFRPKAVIDDADEVHFDDDMLVHGMIWMYLKDDGAVPEMTDEYKSLFDLRFRDLVRGFESAELVNKNAINRHRLQGIPTRWFEQTP